jgi:hypothetical protein
MVGKRSARRARREPNRLHRTTERLEDLLAWSLGVLLVIAACVGWQTGAWVHDTATERARDQAADRTPVTAVLIEGSSPIAGASQSGGVKVPARWTGRDGADHTDRTIVQGIHAAGETVPAWEDGSGHLVAAPITAGEAKAAAIEVGGLAVAFGVGVVYALWLALFTWTARRYARAWEQEWAQVGPEWSGRARS